VAQAGFPVPTVDLVHVAVHRQAGGQDEVGARAGERFGSVLLAGVRQRVVDDAQVQRRHGKAQAVADGHVVLVEAAVAAGVVGVEVAPQVQPEAGHLGRHFRLHHGAVGQGYAAPQVMAVAADLGAQVQRPDSQDGARDQQQQARKGQEFRPHVRSPPFRQDMFGRRFAPGGALRRR